MKYHLTFSGDSFTLSAVNEITSDVDGAMANYNTELITYRIEQKFPGVAKEAVARQSPVCEQTMQRIMRGNNVSVETLREFTDFLGLIWHQVFDPKLKRSDFHRAVVRRSAR